ncbi:hypothetical protein MLD38_011940 [Melastoma candidum]|uniref:Uncharacterized protein n=1 Tax=Melastoma candidum TaxID=119954 RepID=A0ACB9R4Q6_9MYRT|nr:hypothetical protein MLD38_011940 [Melastoma candidum]
MDNVEGPIEVWVACSQLLIGVRYFYMCLNDLLAIGGGGNFALRLDGDLLSGTSGLCETFGNSCLAHSMDFELKNVELWGFIHSSSHIIRG